MSMNVTTNAPARAAAKPETRAKDRAPVHVPSKETAAPTAGKMKPRSKVHFRVPTDNANETMVG
jgi:hypothetical protein